MTKGKTRYQYEWSSLLEKNKNPKSQKRSVPTKAWRFQNLLGRAGKGGYDNLILEGETDGHSYYFFITGRDLSRSPLAGRSFIDVTFPILGPTAQGRPRGISRFVWKHRVTKEELKVMVHKFVQQQRSPDYWHEDTLRLDNKLAKVTKRRNQLEQELRRARALPHLDLLERLSFLAMRPRSDFPSKLWSDTTTQHQPIFSISSRCAPCLNLKTTQASSRLQLNITFLVGYNRLAAQAFFILRNGMQGSAELIWRRMPHTDYEERIHPDEKRRDVCATPPSVNPFATQEGLEIPRAVD